MTNELIQERGELARRIADNCLNIHRDVDNAYVVRYWELTKSIEEYDYYYRLDYKNTTLYFNTYEGLREYAHTLKCDYIIFRPRKEGK